MNNLNNYHCEHFNSLLFFTFLNKSAVVIKCDIQLIVEIICIELK